MSAVKSSRDFTPRPDQMAIAARLEPGCRVLDLGCGDGAFLAYLRDLKGIRGMGIEISQPMIAECIARGVPVVQGNLDSPLSFAGDGSFDWVILSHTLQEVRHPEVLLREIVRVGGSAIVSFLNFGYFRCRLQLLLRGRMPITSGMPHQWYDTPNIHLATLDDLKALCAALGIAVLHETPIVRRGPVWPARLWPNLFAPNCVVSLRRESPGTPQPHAQDI